MVWSAVRGGRGTGRNPSGGRSSDAEAVSRDGSSCERLDSRFGTASRCRPVEPAGAGVGNCSLHFGPGTRSEAAHDKDGRFSPTRLPPLPIRRPSPRRPPGSTPFSRSDTVSPSGSSKTADTRRRVPRGGSTTRTNLLGRPHPRHRRIPGEGQEDSGISRLRLQSPRQFRPRPRPARQSRGGAQSRQRRIVGDVGGEHREGLRTPLHRLRGQERSGSRNSRTP